MLGLMIAADAGYRPRAALRLWRKMGERGGAQAPEFVSTHPSYQTRIDLLERSMPAALRLYESSGRGTSPGPGRTGG